MIIMLAGDMVSGVGLPYEMIWLVGKFELN